MKRHNPFVTNVVLLVLGICLLASPAFPVGAGMIVLALARQGAWGHAVGQEKKRRAARREKRQVQHEINLWRGIGR